MIRTLHPLAETHVVVAVERVDEKPDFCGPDDCHDGPWVRIRAINEFCDYTNSATDAEAYEALGRKVASLVLGEDVLYG